MANNPSARQAAASGGRPDKANGGGKAKNGEALLREDHRKVAALFKEFERETDGESRRAIVGRICDELVIHAMIEEEIFYPACREKAVEDDLLDEAQVEHDSLKLLIRDVAQADPDADFYDAKVKVLSEYVKHHVKEEERAGRGIFAKARKAGVDMDALGQPLQARKQELAAQAEAGRLAPPRLRAIDAGTGGTSRSAQEQDMARSYESDRMGRPDRGRGGADDDGDVRDFARAGRFDRDNWRDREPSEYRGGGSGYTSGGGSYGGGGGEYGSGRGYAGGRNDDDYARESGGRRGGYSGSFEREGDDYRRSLGGPDRGRGRDDDYTYLGGQSRFGNRDAENGNDDRYGSAQDRSRRHRSGSRAGGRTSGYGGNYGNWRED